MLLRKRPDLKVERLSDGAPEMHNLLAAEVNEEKPGTPVDDLVDFWHVMEKLAAAAEVIFAAMSVAHLLRWKLKLLNTPGAVWQIATVLHESGREQVLDRSILRCIPMEAKRPETPMRQPLNVAALGFVGGECVTARANYMRLEARDEAGQLRLEYDRQRNDDWRLLEMRFAGEHLVAAIGDVLAYELRIWDVARPDEAPRVDSSLHDDGQVVLWADPAQPRALVRYRGGVAMLDAAAFALTPVAPFDAMSATYDPSHHRLASGDGFDPAQLTLREFDGHVLRSCSLGNGDVDELLFTGDGRFLAVTQMGRTVVVRDAETLEVRWESTSERILAASPCGRWLALDRALVDLRSFSAVPLPPAGGAVFDPRRGELVLADIERTWRVPLP